MSLVPNRENDSEDLQFLVLCCYDVQTGSVLYVKLCHLMLFFLCTVPS